MKRTQPTWPGIKIALFYFTAVALCQPIHAQSPIPFRLVHNTLIVVSVTANGVGPFDFVLDTGADTTIVDPAIAAQLSLKSLNRVQQTTLASVQSVASATLRSLALDTAQAENLPVLLQDLSSLRQMDPHIVGLAGQDFLSHFNYLLDYHSHSIRIEQGAEIQEAIAGEQVPVRITGNRIFIIAEARSRNRASLRLLLDSGANSVVLLRSASQMLNLPTETSGLEMTSNGHELRPELRLCGHLLEQSSSFIAGLRTCVWINPLGQSAFALLAFACALRHQMAR